MGRRRRYPHNRAHPRYWSTWLGIGVAWLLAQLPWPLLMLIGRGMGRLAWRIAKRRRHIAETNARLCFPECSDAEREAIARQSVEGAGQAIAEAMGSYFSIGLDLGNRLEVVGREHFDAARASGRGVLLLGMHFDTIDISAHLLSCAIGPRFNVVYRPHDNPLLDRVIRRGRGRHLDKSLDRRDVRGMVRALRAGEVVWYAPDQDFGVRHSVFVPFFGVPAATITATARVARMGEALVVPLAQSRQPGGRYRLEFGPALEGFPSGDDIADARRINEVIEHYVRKEPGQYLWVHRRFKHRPPGEPKIY